MLSYHALCIGLLLLPAFPAFGQNTIPQVRAVILPVAGSEADSIQTIIARDLGFGDRVLVVSADGPQRATAVVNGVATAQGLTVSLLDSLNGTVLQQHDFLLPVVTPRNDQAIVDSLNQAFDARDLARRTALVRATWIRDSIQAEMAKKTPRLRNRKAKAEYFAVVTQRDSILSDAVTEMTVVQSERERDQAGRAAVQSSALSQAAIARDSATTARRWAIHGVSDLVEEWMTGHRGIAQSRIAYVSNGEIRVVDFDGANDHAVTRSDKAGVKAMSPAWRGDGGALVYSDMNDAGTQIALVNLMSGQIQTLAATPRGLNITPVFSTDNKWVVYANGTDARTSLVAVRPDSVASLKHLPLNRLFDADEPIFSPDGSRIAYVSSRPRTPQIYSSNLDGTDERVEAPAPAKGRVYHTSPDWSPDGRMIAYQQQNGDFQIWIVNRTDRSVRRVTTQGENEDPSWAPDARHIALTSNRGGAKEIWVLDTQSKRFRQLTSVGDARLAAWSGPIKSTSAIPLAIAR
jgi:tol-pal system beta propeller repeat protein TolB